MIIIIETLMIVNLDYYVIKVHAVIFLFPFQVT